MGRGGAKRGGAGAKKTLLHIAHTHTHAHDAIAQPRLGASERRAAVGASDLRWFRSLAVVLMPVKAAANES